MLRLSLCALILLAACAPAPDPCTGGICMNTLAEWTPPACFNNCISALAEWEPAATLER